MGVLGAPPHARAHVAQMSPEDNPIGACCVLGAVPCPHCTDTRAAWLKAGKPDAPACWTCRRNGWVPCPKFCTHGNRVRSAWAWKPAPTNAAIERAWRDELEAAKPPNY